MLIVSTRVADCGGRPLSDTSIIILYIDFVSRSSGFNVVMRPVNGSANSNLNSTHLSKNHFKGPRN